MKRSSMPSPSSSPSKDYFIKWKGVLKKNQLYKRNTIQTTQISEQRNIKVKSAEI